MTVAEMHYDFKLKMDKVSSFQNRAFNSAEIDWLLNEAQELFVKQRLNGNNIYKAGFEEIQKRIDDLSSIHIKYPVQPAITLVNHGNLDGVYIYECKLSLTSNPYMYFSKASVKLVLLNCVTKAIVKLIQNDDLEQALINPFELTEERVLANFGKTSNASGTSIYIYSKYEIVEEKIYLEYIKRPNQINLGNYTYLDDTTKPVTNCELSEQTHREIVDIAVMIVSGIIESSSYNIKKEKLSINE